MTGIGAVLRSVRAASPAPGMSTSVIALDGYGGAGKSTLAAHLGEVLRAEGRRVDLLHTDDFASADNPLNWWPRLIDQVLQPLRDGLAARYQRYDWDLGELAEWHTVEPGGLILLEGVSASRNAFRPYLGLSVWVETPADERLRRGLERDGEQARAQWDRWMADELAWGRAERPWDRADVVISGTVLGMDEFRVGDVVQITGVTMTGGVGTVVHLDEKRQKYLVRVSDTVQNYFPADELTPFTS